MKISYNWLKKHLDINLPAEELSFLLTDCGLEVEGLEEVCAVKGGLKGVITGHVIHKEKHPDADRLSLTKVDIGHDTVLDIVCGAPNVAQGQKVLVATVGTVIYLKDSSFEIKKSKIRGYASEGMICAEDELGLGTSHDGIIVLPNDAPIGMPASEYLSLESDWVFEIGLTPNRADATSHLGVARDILAVLKSRDILTQTVKHKLKIKDNTSVDLNKISDGKHITIHIADAEACPRYTGITITGVTVGESPEWLKNSLKAIGLKPINNIVDISNYILFDLGQPLHIFDADKIKGDKVVVQKYSENFSFVTLDGQTQQMTPDDLMICNAVEPMCIAGVYGGLELGVTESTKNVFIESAYFNPRTIRRTSKRLGLKTDASFRFERGADPHMTVRALCEAVELISVYAGGRVSSGIIDVYPQPVTNKLVTFSIERFSKIAGKVIDKELIKNILIALEMIIVKDDGDILLLSVPAYRVDVEREIDVAEDVLRIYGYNNVEMPGMIKAALSPAPKPDREKILDTMAVFLSSNGYREIMNNSLSKTDYYQKLDYFSNDQSVKLLNPLSKDLESLRQTLLYSTLETVAYNHNRKNFNLKLFEQGKIYSFDATKQSLDKYSETYRVSLLQTGFTTKESWHKPQEKYQIFSLKADLYALLHRLGIPAGALTLSEDVNTYYSHGFSCMFKKRVLLHAGEIHASVLKYFDIKQPVFYAEIDADYLIDIIAQGDMKYKEIPRFPKMRRDLALLIDEKVSYADIERVARGMNNSLLREINLFDIYRGESVGAGKKSYAVSYIFQDNERTLLDADVDKIMNKLIELYSRNLGAVIR